MFYVTLFNPSTKKWMNGRGFKSADQARDCYDMIKSKLPWARVAILES